MIFCSNCNKKINEQNYLIELEEIGYPDYCLSCLPNCYFCKQKCFKIANCSNCKNFLCLKCKETGKLKEINIEYKWNFFCFECLKNICVICNSNNNLTSYECCNNKCKFKNDQFASYCSNCIIICNNCDDSYCRECNYKINHCCDCCKNYCYNCEMNDNCDCYIECNNCYEKKHYESLIKCDICNLKLCNYCIKKNKHKCKT
jgi:hypothetical protein